MRDKVERRLHRGSSDIRAQNPGLTLLSSELAVGPSKPSAFAVMTVDRKEFPPARRA
jgi:hypothetical protein